MISDIYDFTVLSETILLQITTAHHHHTLIITNVKPTRIRILMCDNKEMCDNKDDNSGTKDDNENNFDHDFGNITVLTRISKERKTQSQNPLRPLFPSPCSLPSRPSQLASLMEDRRRTITPTSFPFSIPVNYSSRETRLKHPGNTT